MKEELKIGESQGKSLVITHKHFSDTPPSQHWHICPDPYCVGFLEICAVFP